MKMQKKRLGWGPLGGGGGWVGRRIEFIVKMQEKSRKVRSWPGWM